MSAACQQHLISISAVSQQYPPHPHSVSTLSPEGAVTSSSVSTLSPEATGQVQSFNSNWQNVVKTVNRFFEDVIKIKQINPGFGSGPNPGPIIQDSGPAPAH